MRRSTIISGAILAGAIGLGLVATPVLAAQFGDTTTAGTAPAGNTTANPITGDPVAGNPQGGKRWDGGGPAATDSPAGAGMGRGYRGGAGGAASNGAAGNQGTGCPCTDTATYPSGTLTDAQKSALAGMAEDEKLAHDVYVALAASSGDVRFTRIAAAESNHLSAVRTLLERYGVTDPTAGLADGRFTSSDVQATYDKLVAQGKASLTAALEVGQSIEKLDIADLDKAGSGVDAADVTAVYAHLKAASQRHLASFGG